ncbi:hypothetical protein dsx2_0607 [Desulfovibrio sp. X2]|uniref:YybH family protein n=1 Tax=Desulfovibrio sp. X2 TaxID=941449 RepID=UPI000358AF45|nr:nuclear transport factor 2 family protein [Desulfovibrio sp. X2]EPR37675.1 hypothetical protein dsx2_0607 [Desulfovibrio sp. X2]
MEAVWIPITEPITGNEEPGDPGRPEHGLIQFYKAFNGRDLALMGENWLREAGDIAMDNPLGGIMRGWEEISAVYARIFGGPATVRVEFHDYTLHAAQDVFYAVGRERGEFARGAERLDLRIRTTRVFRLAGGRWRQVHHHGSIDDPKLLARYQAAVAGK